ncbi:hypothetical protein TraAM80_10588, partial [Trypanosoma rangeli]
GALSPGAVHSQSSLGVPCKAPDCPRNCAATSPAPCGAGALKDSPSPCVSGLHSSPAGTACESAGVGVSLGESPRPAFSNNVGRTPAQAQHTPSAPAFSHFAGGGAAVRGGVPGAAPADRVEPTSASQRPVNGGPAGGGEAGQQSASGASGHGSGQPVRRAEVPRNSTLTAATGGTQTPGRHNAGEQAAHAAPGAKSNTAGGGIPHTKTHHKTHTGRRDSSDTATVWVRSPPLLLLLLLLAAAVACAAGQC